MERHDALIGRIPPKLPIPLPDALCGELREDERVVWVGRPVRNPDRRNGMLFVAPCCAVLGALTLALGLAQWLGIPSRLGVVAPDAATCAIAGTILVLSWLPFSFPASRTRRTVYAITDQRAIVIPGHLFARPRARSYGRPELNSAFVRECDDGTGDLVFRERVVESGEGAGDVEYEGFLEIASVRFVESLLDSSMPPSHPRH